MVNEVHLATSESAGEELIENAGRENVGH